MSLLAVTILGAKIAARDLAIAAVVVVVIVGAVAWFVYTRRTR